MVPRPHVVWDTMVQATSLLQGFLERGEVPFGCRPPIWWRRSAAPPSHDRIDGMARTAKLQETHSKSSS